MVEIDINIIFQIILLENVLKKYEEYKHLEPINNTYYAKKNYSI